MRTDLLHQKKTLKSYTLISLLQWNTQYVNRFMIRIKQFWYWYRVALIMFWEKVVMYHRFHKSTTNYDQTFWSMMIWCDVSDNTGITLIIYFFMKWVNIISLCMWKKVVCTFVTVTCKFNMKRNITVKSLCSLHFINDIAFAFVRYSWTNLSHVRDLVQDHWKTLILVFIL